MPVFYQMTCYFFQYQNLVDLIAIVPYYIQLATGGPSLSIFRVMRVLPTSPISLPLIPPHPVILVPFPNLTLAVDISSHEGTTTSPLPLLSFPSLILPTLSIFLVVRVGYTTNEPHPITLT